MQRVQCVSCSSVQLFDSAQYCRSQTNERTHQPRGLTWSSQDGWPAQRPVLLRPQMACMRAYAVNFRSTGMKQFRP
jgi:hypothetical protein